MVDVGGITRFTPGERTLRLVMDIAAALERYRIVMEGPSGVRLRKLVDFMLDMILRTLKARGESQGGKKKVARKGGKKTVDLLLELIRGDPKITFAEMVSAAGISRSAIQKHIERIKDAQRLRRIGPDKGDVRYALDRTMSPMMVAEYRRLLIPEEMMKKSLEEYCEFMKRDSVQKR